MSPGRQYCLDDKIYFYYHKNQHFLISKIFPRDLSPEHSICVIPQQSDLEYIESILTKNNEHIKLICVTTDSRDFENNVNNLLRNITKCEKVLTSCLEGLAVAHSYGIPAAAISFIKSSSGNFKFRDYYESLGIYMSNASIRRMLIDTIIMGNLSFLTELIDRTPQPKHPLDTDSIIETFPFPIRYH